MDGRRSAEYVGGISAKLWTIQNSPCQYHHEKRTKGKTSASHTRSITVAGGKATLPALTHSLTTGERWRPLYSPRSTMGKGDAPSRSDSPTPSRSQNEKKPKPLPAWNNKAPWYVIDPRTSRYIGKWDVFTSVALLFVAFVTPFEVALLEPTLDTLFIMNRAVDLIFGIDMVFSFLTVYSVRDVYITDPCKIACHYLRTWCVAGCP